MTGAQMVIDILVKQGVSDVFGYPGGAIMPIYDALYGAPLKHYLTRHEQGAGFAAVGYARSTGKLGVCFATSGPGATNLVTALADAMMDSVPLLAITGQVPTAAIGSDAFQEVDVLGMSLSCTKHSFMVERPEELAEVLQQAMHLAVSGRPGPVLVDIPKDIQQALVSFSPWSAHSEEQDAPLLHELNLANELLNNAQKPVAYVGGGVQNADAQPALMAFLAQTNMPAVSTLKALGSVLPEYEYDLGMLGMHGTKAANLAVQECDLLVCIGARFDDRVTGNLAKFASKAKVIHLDIDAAEIGKRKPAAASLVADLNTSLPLLQGVLAPAAWRAHISRMKQEHAWRYDYPGEKVFAPYLLNKLSQDVPSDTVVCCDVGQHQMWVAQHMKFAHPSNHLSSGGAGTMGFGLPAAIGAKIARPDSMVITVSGDGSIMMNIQELATIRRNNLAVKIVILDNQRLGMVRQWQELFFSARYSETNLSDNPDFVQLAAVFGIPGQTITHASEVDDAIKQLVNSEGPYILHACIDDKENVWPLVPPGAANDEMLTENTQ
ncbi:acetolactate synthase 2 catalytic subunit [Pseudoalteromonas luteoviolacea]|uniref:Acetolactate synthase n=1 Tax=Pseudoalteromonas luteoviolacea S4054 TaxID=1129367 RepID=A0A0F6A4A7_9GAMM|nr:acetolactate synthase 2 catalytic subunit [Pseudoalteromonas luteoviolacea]AOT06633.1 acetolactate synthase 2 catalytic subunit [Pseudoalteromonas luteoviolacea]AOT11550.1 acetolactate synthase 2 catalytic subunit [Pseudoalteromonas luteoviolacea]AOT16463.1 acetolactate synthase 2 catalytic subunit [Pseudoalteromonas luteoviolacea]KKE81047.1 acetolactate synthase [Pseudoalteromonas luteoviolacea S4054]KZN62545.1 acetolactate synthase [Pseudoalteromonas luteoviolacea S4047-1]